MRISASPPIFAKTPQEYIWDQNLSHLKRQRMGASARNATPRPEYRFPPKGQIRVHFHKDIESIRRESFPDFWANVPISSTGELDVAMLRMTWGLETCAPVDPMRWDIFNTSDENRLSPLAVHTLLDGSLYGGGVYQGRLPYIAFIEPTASELTQFKRKLRVTTIIRFYFLYTLFHLVFHGGVSDDTSSVPLSQNYWDQYRHLMEGRLRLARCASKWKRSIGDIYVSSGLQRRLDSFRSNYYTNITLWLPKLAILLVLFVWLLLAEAVSLGYMKVW